MSDAIGHYVKLFGSTERRDPAWLSELRTGAMGTFERLGLPTKRHEDWKHTSLRSFAGERFERTGAAGTPGDLLPPPLEGTVARVVLVDGQVTERDTSGLPEGARITSLGEEPDLAARFVHGGDRTFVALNTAFLDDALIVYVTAGTDVAGPIELVHVTTGEGRATHLRHVVVAERGSRATVVERYVGGGQKAFNNVVTEVTVGDGAQVHHVKLQTEGAGTTHIASVDVHQGRDSRFVSHSISLGGQLARTEIRTELAGQGAEVDLFGIYLGREAQHLDQLTLVDHAVPHCRSNEVYKGILDQKATGVFNGKVVVRPDAQKTDAAQSNRNLVLSDDANAHTRPQLEIHADDVKCAHGATVGALDTDALFFLRSRGIPLDRARAMLTHAFAHDVIASLDEGAVRDEVTRLVTEWMPA